MYRKFLGAALGATMLLSTAAPALAHPTIQLDPALPLDVTHWKTDNVEYLGRFPEHASTAGGRLVGDTFYVTDGKGVFAYDVTTPESPSLLGALPLPQHGAGLALAQEDPDTDGEIMILDANVPGQTGTARFTVVDVSDPANMSVLAQISGLSDHTWTCVSATDEGKCDYAYGRSGGIVDLTDPSKPALLPFTWRAFVKYGNSGNSPYTHDLTQIRPGLVMSAGADSILMDTTDPLRPVRLAMIEGQSRFSSLGMHSVEWSNGGADSLMVAGTEIAPSGATNTGGSDCVGENSVVESYDTSALQAALTAYYDVDGPDYRNKDLFDGLTFEKKDAFDAGARGIFIQGQAPGHVLYCAHWMELHPDFADGGLMAVSYYDRGTRFVNIAADGSMEEVGWMTPAEGYSGSVQWITDEIVYVMDYRRGMEVLRLKPAEATGVVAHGFDVVAAGSVVSPLHHGDEGLPLQNTALLLLGLTGIAVARFGRRQDA